MRETVKIENTKIICDVTGKEIKEKDFENWWVCVSGGTRVIAEYFTPMDLCKEFQEALYDLFDRDLQLCLREKFIYERYNAKPEVTPELIENFKQALKDNNCYPTIHDDY